MEERQSKLREVGNKTREDVLEKLNAGGRCLVDRPTGFGKTYLLCKVGAEYAKKYPDKKIIYIYPNDIIINEIMSNSEYNDVKYKLSFLSYQKISQNFSENGKGRSKESILNLIENASIILVDEVHKTGAPGFQVFFEQVEHFIGADKVHMLGVTATVDRANKEETDWIKDYMFQGTEAYFYNLGSAINDGVLLAPVIHRPIFNIDNLIETFEGEIKAKHSKNKFFNQNDFERRLQNLRINFSDAGKQLYDEIKKVGYRLDSDNPDDSYLKFIVFFKDTDHLVEEGENIENCFRDAVNGAASADLGKKIKTTLSVEYVISDTADGSHEYEVKKFCEKESFRTYRNKPVEVGTYKVEKDEPVLNADGTVKTDKNGKGVYKKKKVTEYIKPKAHHIDLIFNVGTLIMGYHVPYTSGVMMLRSTSTGTMFYQQIGRCFSVKSTKHPIIFDVVSNTVKDYSVEPKADIIRHIAGDNTLVERLPNEDREDYQEQTATQVGVDVLATEVFLQSINAMRQDDYFELERIQFLYKDCNMPIAFIANDMGISCKRVAQVLQRLGIELVSEDNEYKYLESKFEKFEDGKLDVDSDKDSLRLMGYLNSRLAHKLFKKYKNFRSLLDLLAKIGRVK